MRLRHKSCRRSFGGTCQRPPLRGMRHSCAGGSEGVGRAQGSRRRGDGARLRALLALPRRRRRAGRRRAASWWAATSRTRRTASCCAPSADGVPAARHRGRPADALRVRQRRRRRDHAVRPVPPAALRARRARPAELWTVSGIKPMSEVLPDAFGPDDLPTWPTRSKEPTDARPRRRRGDPRQARQARAQRQPDRLGDRRLHPRRGRRRADVGARDGDPAQRDEPHRDRPLDRAR